MELSLPLSSEKILKVAAHDPSFRNRCIRALIRIQTCYRFHAATLRDLADLFIQPIYSIHPTQFRVSLLRRCVLQFRVDSIELSNAITPGASTGNEGREGIFRVFCEIRGKYTQRKTWRAPSSSDETFIYTRLFIHPFVYRHPRVCNIMRFCGRRILTQVQLQRLPSVLWNCTRDPKLILII